MSCQYFDDEGNEMQPITCESCRSIIGWANEEIDEPIWCDKEDCIKVELKQEKR